MAQMNVLGGLVFALCLLVPLTSAKTIDVNYCTKTPTSAWISLQQPVRLQDPNFQQLPVQPESVAATHTAKEHPAKSLCYQLGSRVHELGKRVEHPCMSADFVLSKLLMQSRVDLWKLLWNQKDLPVETTLSAMRHALTRASHLKWEVIKKKIVLKL